MKAPTPRRLLLGLIACASLAALPTAAQAAASFSLAGDFSYTENNEDSIWSFRMDDWLTVPPTFLPLLISTDLDANQLWGTDFGFGSGIPAPKMWSEGTGYWGIGKNTSGSSIPTSTTLVWPKDAVLLHPKGGDTPPARLVSAWTAPSPMLIEVNYTFARFTTAGNGIGYELRTRIGGVDTEVVAFNNIGTSVTRTQAGIQVGLGDQLFFRFDTWGDAGGDITRVAIEILEVTGKPEIVTQPSGGNLVEGSDFTLSVSATGAATYQWLKNGNPISGATAASYPFIKGVKPSDAGTYSVVLANTSGTTTSDNAVLAVTPGPSFATYSEAVLSDNPIHYYPLDETSGTVATDLGTLATVGGTYLGGFTLGQDAVTPRLGKCVRLDGTPGTLVDLGLFHPGDSVSVEAWANLDLFYTAAFAIVAGRMDGSYEIDVAPNDIVNWNVFRDGGGFGQAVASSSSARRQWHHITGVFDSSTGTLTVYVDGVKGSERFIGGVLQNLGPTPDRVMIGASRSGSVSSFNWKGFIDEVAFYDYALSPVQIRAHYRNLAAAPPSLTKQSGVIVSWPNFPPNYVLQSATNVTGPYENSTGSIFTEGSYFVAPVPIGPPQKFFQLLKP